jgi:hypothetical protein
VQLENRDCRKRFVAKLLGRCNRGQETSAKWQEFPSPCDSTFFTVPQVKNAKGRDATVCEIIAKVCNDSFAAAIVSGSRRADVGSAISLCPFVAVWVNSTL